MTKRRKACHPAQAVTGPMRVLRYIFPVRIIAQRQHALDAVAALLVDDMKVIIMEYINKYNACQDCNIPRC